MQTVMLKVIFIPVARVRLVLASVHSDLGLTSTESASAVLYFQENLTYSLRVNFYLSQSEKDHSVNNFVMI